VVSKGENFAEKQAVQQLPGFTEQRLDLSFCMPSIIRVDRTTRPIFPTDWSAGPNLACKSAALVCNLIGVSYQHQIVQIKKVMERTSAENLRSRRSKIFIETINSEFWPKIEIYRGSTKDREM
jgi:hypothetical protein